LQGEETEPSKLQQGSVRKKGALAEGNHFHKGAGEHIKLFLSIDRFSGGQKTSFAEILKKKEDSLRAGSTGISGGSIEKKGFYHDSWGNAKIL